MSEALTNDVEQADQPRLTSDLVRASRTLVWVLLGAVALLFVVRRLSGELRQALPGEAFMAVAAGVELLVWWLRWPAISQLHGSESVTRLPPWPGWIDAVGDWWRLNRESLVRVGWASVGGTVVVVLLVGALSLPGTGVFALLMGWGFVLTLEGMSFAFGCGWRRIQAAEPAAGISSANQASGSAVVNEPRSIVRERRELEPTETEGLAEDFVGVKDFDEADELADESDELLPPDVLQQTTRTRLAAGGEGIEQFMRCSFPPEQTLQVMHLAFCPPLARKPTLEADQLDGPEATIKATLVETFGARLEIRLAEPAEQQVDVVLRVWTAG